MNKVSLETLAYRIAVIMANLKPFEKIEIKLNDNSPGELSVLVTSNHKEIFTVE